MYIFLMVNILGLKKISSSCLDSLIISWVIRLPPSLPEACSKIVAFKSPLILTVIMYILYHI